MKMRSAFLFVSIFLACVFVTSVALERLSPWKWVKLFFLVVRSIPKYIKKKVYILFKFVASDKVPVPRIFFCVPSVSPSRCSM